MPLIEPSETMMLAMRDGIRLYTELYFPQGASAVPTILIRTPYPASTFQTARFPIELFRSAGYAVAEQWCRGTWKSEGQFRYFQNEPEDGYDADLIIRIEDVYPDGRSVNMTGEVGFGAFRGRGLCPSDQR